MKKLTTLLTVILFISSSALAQLGTIKGIVKDKKTGETIPGASVYIETGGNKQGTASDIDGKYTITPVNVGTHTVNISVIGYQPMKISNIPISSNRIAYVNIDMIAGIEMDEFEVIEVIHKVPLIDPDEPNVKMLVASDLKNDPNIHTPVAIINRIEGVTVADNGRDVYVKGSRPQATQFITDGMKSITGDIGIPGQAIGSIKVYTGGVPANYGDLTGGVIVVETKSYFDLAQEYK
jgi:hypothetical protein